MRESLDTAFQEPNPSKSTAWISYQETTFRIPESTTLRRSETDVTDEKLGINHLNKVPKQGDRRGQSVEPLAANLVLRDSGGILGPST